MPQPEQPTRLDPDRAIEQARGAPETPPPRRPAPAIDTRRYQWMIGGFGLLLLIIFSVYLYSARGSSSVGVPAGRAIPRFVAPLATSNLNLPANAHPRCNPARPARRGLNVCGRGALVLAFFVPSAASCVQEVSTLQDLAGRFPRVHFAAVAINAGRTVTARLVRLHRWRIPVAYDLTGSVGQLYGIAGCPIIELVRPGGIVARRLIGEQSPAALAPQVARLAGSAGGAAA